MNQWEMLLEIKWWIKVPNRPSSMQLHFLVDVQEDEKDLKAGIVRGAESSSAVLVDNTAGAVSFLMTFASVWCHQPECSPMEGNTFVWCTVESEPCCLQAVLCSKSWENLSWVVFLPCSKWHTVSVRSEGIANLARSIIAVSKWEVILCMHILS